MKLKFVTNHNLAINTSCMGLAFNSSPPSGAYMGQWIGSALVQLMTCHQAIISINRGLSSSGSLGTNFKEILIKIQNCSFMKMHLKIPSVKWSEFCPDGDELILHSSHPRDLPPCLRWQKSKFSVVQQVMSIRSPFYYHGLTLIPARISNQKPWKVSDKLLIYLSSYKRSIEW